MLTDGWTQNWKKEELKTLSGMVKGSSRLTSAGLEEGGGGCTVWGEAEAGLINAQSMQMAWPLPVLNFL